MTATTGLPVATNLLPSDPLLADALDLHRKSIMLGLNCHAIGTIQTFDPTTQTATVTVNYVRTYLEFNTEVQQYVSVGESYPPLLDCPVGCLGGGPAVLEFPITTGDECLIFVNDRDIDTWMQGVIGAPVNTPRMHSFSDCLVLVGFRSQANAKALGVQYDMSRAVLRGGKLATSAVVAASPTVASLESAGPTGAKVAAGPTLVTISVTNQTLGAQLQSLIMALEILNTAIATFGTAAAAQTPPVPSGTALATAAVTATSSITLVATALAGILA